MPIRNLTHGSLKVLDGTSPTPNELDVACQKGDLKWARSQESKLVQNRGENYELTRGPETAIPVTFTAAFERLEGKTGASTPTLYEALHQEGPAASWISTLVNKLNSPFGLTLRFTLQDVEGEDADGENEIFDFEEFVCDKFDFSEGSDANEVTVTGKCRTVKPVVSSVAT